MNLCTRFALLISLTTFVSAANAGTYDWFEYNGNSYALTLVHGSWNDAQNEAESLGFDLVSIEDGLENQFLVDTFAGIDVGVNSLWIGLQQQPGAQNTVDGWMTWQDGSSVGYTNWFSNEPNDEDGIENGEEDFAHMYNDFDAAPNSAGTWNDKSDIAGLYPGIIETPEPATLSLLLLGTLLLKKRRF